MSNELLYLLPGLAGFVIGFFGAKCYFKWRDRKRLKEMASKYPWISEAGKKNLKDAYDKLVKTGLDYIEKKGGLND